MKAERLLRRFDADGKYIGPADKTVRVDGVRYDMYEYAKSQGIKLPEHKEHKPKKKEDKEVNSYADMGQPLDEGHPEIDGDGDSQGEE